MQMVVKGTDLTEIAKEEIGDRPCFSLQAETGNVHE